MGDLAAKYLFLVALYGFVLFGLVQVVRALGAAAGATKAKAREAPAGAASRPLLLIGDRQIRLPGRGEFVIGRGEDCGLVLEDPFVSQAHVAIVCERGRCLLKDLGSKNGTRLNGAPVQQAELTEGDRIELGATAIVFRLGG